MGFIFRKLSNGNVQINSDTILYTCMPNDAKITIIDASSLVINDGKDRLLVRHDNVDIPATNNIYELFYYLAHDYFSPAQTVISGTNSAGNQVNFQPDKAGNFPFTPKDSFLRLPVANPFGIWDSSQVFSYGRSMFWSDFKTGSATITHRKASSATRLSVGPGEIAATQTKMRFKYQPYKSHEPIWTGHFEGKAGIEIYCGLADLDNYDSPVIDGTIRNGLVYVNINGVPGFRIYNNGVYEECMQPDWGIDKLDGTGLSGITLSAASTQIALGGIEWLGVGDVSVGFVIQQTFIKVHTFRHANEGIPTVYMRTANLPVLYMIKSTTGTGYLDQICNAVVSGGGYEPIGVKRMVEAAIGNVITGGTTELLIGIRLKPEAYEASVKTLKYNALVSTSGDMLLFFAYNPVYTNTVTWIDKVDSHVQYAIGTNNVVSNYDYSFAPTYISADNDDVGLVAESKVSIGKGISNVNAAGPYDELWLCAKAISTNETLYATIEYEDLF